MGETLTPRSMNLLSGKLSRDDIPSVKAHVIRVYFCSAGTDSMTERDIFVENVYPRLRAYCKDRYGLEFQVVDLNWGLSSDAIDNQTDITPLRIREIQRSHALSASLNFIAFLGQRYGQRSLPDVILSEEYDAIQLALRAHKGRDTRNAPLLDQCYIIDDNNIPPAYVLKDKTVLVPDLNDNNEDNRRLAQTKWEELQTDLRNLLQKGAELAYLDGSMDSESKERFFVSELENQMSLGVETSDCPRKKCVLITRNIDDLKNYTQDPRTPRFAEIKYNEREEKYELDGDSASLLVRLKNRMIGLVSQDNHLHYDVLWRYDDVIHPQLHKSYLHSLSEEFYHTCIRLIDEGAPLPEDDAPSACEETMHHWSQCRYMASHFYNQEAALEKLKEYVTGYSTTSLVVHGATGCGKSKIVSKLAFDMEDVLTGDYMVVLRYISLTTKSHDLRQLLSSICTQVVMAMGKSADEVPPEMKDLVKYFLEMVTTIPASTRLVIFLDGLELLLPDYVAFNLHWVPTSLPPNVKLVITVHSTTHGLLDLLTHQVLPQNSPENALEILPITVDECTELLSKLLAEIDRSVTPVQMNSFRKALENEPLPLYVELLANIAKDINSFTDVENLQLPKNCEEGITSLFERLESKHGVTLVSRAFAYLVASRTGLSDCEMEDILSLDEEVLNEVHTDFHPPVRRIPYIKWLSLKQDVESFMSYRDADGVTVAIWQHDSFIDAVNKRYLNDKDVTNLIHTNIADYFLGTWAGRAKPAAVPNGKRLAVASYNLDRKVPTQPHTFGGTFGLTTRFNKRMYDQVPRHLDLSGRYSELNSLVFFNYEWLYSKIKALSLQHIMADFALNPSEEANLVEEALRLSESTIERDINSLPIEISGHLLPYYVSHTNIRSLIRQCDTEGLRHCALVPNFPYQQVPGSSLQFTFECPAVMDHFKLLHEDRYLVCKKRDDAYVHKFDMVTGDLQNSVFVSNGELYTTPNGKYFTIVDHVTEKAIKIHESETGAYLKQIILMNHIDGKSNLYKKGPLCVTDDRLCAIVTLTNSVLCICDIPSGNVLHIITLDGKSNVCNITPNGRQVFCNSNAFLLAYDLYTLEHLLTVPIGAKPSNIVFTHDGLRAFLSNNNDAKVTIMHLNNGVVDMTYRAVLKEKMPEDTIQGLTVSPNDALLLVRGKKHLLVHHRGLEKVIAVFNRPDSVPEEFKLPRAQYVQIKFTHAQFTKDSNFVIGAIFRNVYVWQISNSTLITSLQAPIGLITFMLVSSTKSQVITHMENSKKIEVWNIDEAVKKVSTPDKLTDAISEFQLTADNSIAYVRCQLSDELGVIDMRSGAMLDLLTHDMPIYDFAISPNGGWVLVSTNPRLKETAFKLWNTEERRVVLETGCEVGYCVGTHSSPSIIMVAQKSRSFKAPYYISVFHFVNDEFYEHAYTQTLSVVRSKPFVTIDDQYLVISSALCFDESNGSFSQPCIHVFHIENGMKMETYDGASLKFQEHLLDILEVRPCRQQNGSIIAAIISCNDHYRDESPALDANDSGYASSRAGCPYGFFLLDAATGSMTLLCIPFPKPSYGFGANPLAFAQDCSMCLDETSNIFHIQSGEFIGQIPTSVVPPRSFVLRGTIVLYFHNTFLQAVRISDDAVLANCDVHAPICLLHVCGDNRTILVGCEDGTVLSYTIIDPTRENSTFVLSNLPSRKIGNPDIFERRLSRSWDTIEQNFCPSYSRPPSSISPRPKDKQLLRQIKALPRDRPKSDTIAQIAPRSQACLIM